MNVSGSYWKDRRVLITGITGFVGSWMAEALIPLGARVHGFLRRHAVPNYCNIEHLMGRIEFVRGDLNDSNSIAAALKRGEIDVLFHLAAQSFVPQSFKAPVDTYLTNVIGTVNVLEAVRVYDGLERMHFSGSSEEYGLVLPEELPIKETNPLRPMSPYGVSKIAGDFACYNHFKSYGVPVVRTRAFNHTGPRRGQSFVTATVTRQVAEVKLGKRDALELGNLDARRDFSDVRDIAKGYLLAVEKGAPGEVYNLASGRAWSVRELVEMASRLAGVKPAIRQDPARMRPSDVPLLVGDYSKAKAAFGYEPKIPFEKTISDMLAWQEDNVRHGKLVSPDSG